MTGFKRRVQAGPLLPVILGDQEGNLLTGFEFGAFAIPIVALENQLIRRGLVFDGDSYNASLANGANLDVLIVTGAKSPRIALNVQVAGDCTFTIREAVTTSADGSSLPLYNMDRTSVVTMLSTAFTGPTVTDLGTQIHLSLVAGGSGGNADGGDRSFDRHRILKPNTKYLLRLNNISGQSRAVSIDFKIWELPE